MGALAAFFVGPVGRWLAAAAAGGLLLLAAYGKGYVDGRDDMQAHYESEQRRIAQERIETMENRNEKFRDLSARERCLALARDSGMPEAACGD